MKKIHSSCIKGDENSIQWTSVDGTSLALIESKTGGERHVN